VLRVGEETENADDDVGAMGSSKVTNVVRDVVVMSFILGFLVFFGVVRGWGGVADAGLGCVWEVLVGVAVCSISVSYWMFA